MDEITSDHFTELLAAEVLNPQSAWRDDLRMGIICSTIANSAPFRGRGAKAYAASDFIPKYGEARKRKGARELAEQFRAWSAASGGR